MKVLLLCGWIIWGPSRAWRFHLFPVTLLLTAGVSWFLKFPCVIWDPKPKPFYSRTLEFKWNQSLATICQRLPLLACLGPFYVHFAWCSCVTRLFLYLYKCSFYFLCGSRSLLPKTASRGQSSAWNVNGCYYGDPEPWHAILLKYLTEISVLSHTHKKITFISVKIISDSDGDNGLAISHADNWEI